MDRDRAARQFLETSALMGVDFVPVATTSGVEAGSGVEEEQPTPRAPTPSAPTSGTKRERLDALRARYEQEAELPGRMPGWTNIVFEDGDPDAGLMLIGEAPGADEDASGVPFVGRAGKKLTEMIVAMGLSRETVYIANVLKVRPPDNRTPTREEALLDGPWLLEQIGIVEPKVIVTLGRPASQFILDDTESSMGQMRGRFHDFDGIPVMPTYHPAYLLRAYTPENRKKVWSDLQQVMQRLRA